MAAPSGTVWGDIVTGSTSGRKGKLGIYTRVNSTNTQSTVTVEVWFWTIYSCDDSSNTLKYNAGTSTTSATTSVKTNIDINHTVTTGSGWSTSNQTKIYTKTYTYTRGTSATTYKVYAELEDIDMLSGTVKANTSYTVPKLASYTVSYDANGGTVAPSSQTKYYGIDIKVPTTTPIRTGYIFQGWSVPSRGYDNVYYDPGETIQYNGNQTMVAVWKIITYTVTYDANGGSGVPGPQTKTYGVTLKLSSTKPTRTNHNFLGWATSASATTATYVAGANYTTNADATLYAVWELAYVKPRIDELSVGRFALVDNDNVIEYKPSDAGAYVIVSFGWTCDRSASSITIELEPTSGEPITRDLEASWTTGTVSEIFENVPNDLTYTAKITVRDELGYHTEIATLPGSKFVIDILAEGKGIAFNKPAELEGVADFGFQTRLLGGIMHPYLEPETDLDDIRIPNTYIGANISTNNYNCTTGLTQYPDSDGLPIKSGTFTLEVVGMGEDGQVKQKLTYCHKTLSKTWERIYHSGGNGIMSWGNWVCVTDYASIAVEESRGTVLWDGVYYMTAGHTANLSERISEQRNGIVLVFSLYKDGAALDQELSEFFISKYTIAKYPGVGRNFNLCGHWGNCAKYLYLHDDKIVGNENNNATDKVVGGITYNNTRYVLRHVIGV